MGRTPGRRSPGRGRDQQAFALLIRTLATVSRFLPAPVSRFPFNACLADLRLRRMLPSR
ncbi:MAG TPA: hypothetical protein VGF32_11975 [Streptosporangiaceae bacterium]